MKPTVISVRPFIGARNFEKSRSFYKAIGFEEVVISKDMSVFKMDKFAFYLQAAYVKDWIDNTMVFLEIQELDEYLAHLNTLDLSSKFEKVRLSKIIDNYWGREFFLHDPSGVLWHIGCFY